MICLTESERDKVMEIIQEQAPDCEVLIFGSRYRGKCKPYSDLDIAVRGKGRLQPGQIDSLQEAFQESELNFRVDVLDYSAVSEEFRAIIDAGNEYM